MNDELVRYAMRKAYDLVRYYPVSPDPEAMWDFIVPADLTFLYVSGRIDLPTFEDGLDHVLPRFRI